MTLRSKVVIGLIAGILLVVGGGLAYRFVLRAPKPTLKPVVLVPSCDADLDAALDRDEPNAAARAETCADFTRAARGHWQRAEFGKASLAFSVARASAHPPAPSASEVAAHLFAGNLRGAATAARAMAAWEPSKPAWLCLADALDAKAGDAKAQDRLAAAADGKDARLCAPLWFDRVPTSERAAAITGHWHLKWGYLDLEKQGLFYDPMLYDNDRLDDHVVYLLHHEVEPSRAIIAPVWYRADAFWPGRNLLRLPIGLLENAKPTIKDKELRSDFDIHTAAFFSYLGDHAHAREVIDFALDTTDGHQCADDLEDFEDPWDRWERDASGDDDPDAAPPKRNPCVSTPYVLAAGAAIALRAHDYHRAANLLHQAGVHIEAHAYDLLHPYIELMEKGDQKAFDAIAELHPKDPYWLAAASRDGATLLSAFEHDKVDGRDVLPYVVAYMRTGNDALKDFVARSYPPLCWTCGPHELLDHFSHRRDAAQALGMTELDADLEPTAQRLREAFLRRDVAVPLHVLWRLTH